MASATKKRLPRVRPELSVRKGATADTCHIDVLGEGICLVFTRLPDGQIWKTAQERDFDGAERASYVAFMAARALARTTMNDLQVKDKERIARVHDKIIVDSSECTECVLVYLGWRISYTCEASLHPLWDNVKFAAKMDDKTHRYGIVPIESAPMLYEEEWHALHQRAVSAIRNARLRSARLDADSKAEAELRQMQPSFL